uniref:Putative ovule protein n=1 Tax=Solanum chacoense TaxID=4108 RepID=A0A0V0GSJ5_SOLCH
MVATKVPDINANANEHMRRMSTTEVAVFCSDDFLSGLIKTWLEMIRNARKTTDTTKIRTDIHCKFSSPYIA